ncbi:PPE family protein [Mycobacterium sp. M1]|uniref:PPE family protein n=1 Tax=Mycolicibacter acidiphilus TaxID=2835306 RepID=A0ABS5RN00_9MYCO|nr:PPE family protein [Mycolicibacter acidiphilus]
MDYGALPPEVNSLRMYTGPGSTPMMTAAAAWRGLAAEVAAAASSYETVISQLTGEEWAGPASASMAAAASPYVTWMNATAAQAEQAANQATAAAAAYEAARAATVPPAAVAANRTQLAALVSTNVLGVNTAAIAATEAHYGAMWAQDTAAMYGYAAASAAATKVTPFSEPRQTTNPGGQANQAAAVSQASGTAAINTAQSAQLMSSMPSALQSLSAPATGSAQAGSVIDFLNSILNNNALNGAAYLIGNPLYNFTNTMGTGAAFIPSSLLPSLVGYLTGGGFSAAGGSALGGSALGSGLGAVLGPAGPLSALGALGGLGSGAAGGISSAFGVSAVTPVSAGMGQASLVGSSFSAPASWATAAGPAVSPVAAQASGWAVPSESHSMAAMPPAVPGGAGRPGLNYGAPRYGFRLKVMHRPMVC